MTADLALDAAFTAVPADWATRRFRNVVERREERRGTRPLQLLSLASAGYLHPRTDATDRQQASEEGTQRCLVVRQGDLVVNPMWLTGGSVAVSGLEGAVSPDYRVFQPREDVHPRFLHHLLRSDAYMDQYRLYTRADTTFDRRVQQQDLNDMAIRLPPLEEQRRIADFLDDQVARIDKIVEARQQQISLLQAGFASALEELFMGASSRTRPLATLTDPRRPIQYGIVLPGPDFPGGVPIVKGGDVAAGRLNSIELKRTDPKIEAAYSRSRLTGGDLVISIRGSVGEIGVIPDELHGANLTQDAARIAPMGVDARWLRWVLVTPTVQSDIKKRITGAMVTGINIEALRRVAVPVADQEAQESLGRAAEALDASYTGHRLDALRSVALLKEFKQSLISAAVSGAIDLSVGSGPAVRA